MARSAIVTLLVSEGQRLFDAHPTFIEFTKIPHADKLLNDLENHPHAYVLGLRTQIAGVLTVEFPGDSGSNP